MLQRKKIGSLELSITKAHSQPPLNKTGVLNFRKLRLKVILLIRTFGRVALSGRDLSKEQYNVEQLEQEDIAEMTAIGRMKFVEEELIKVLRGQSTMMSCPYCHKLNVKPEDPEKPEPLCCRLFAMASIAAMSGQEVQEALDRAARIADKVHG